MSKITLPDAIKSAALGLQITPIYLYDREFLRKRAQLLVSLDLPFGYTPRYAVKANPHPEVISLLDSMGMHFDASSDYEAYELISYGVDAHKISLSSQQPHLMR